MYTCRVKIFSKIPTFSAKFTPIYQISHNLIFLMKKLKNKCCIFIKFT